MTQPKHEFDYIIVGSGAGGGPLAANLAKKGHAVLLLEAGGDPGDRLSYQVPAFHGLATEDPAMSWDYFVRHYTDDTKGAEDSKFNPEKKGVWYPRASALGGCTAHNALITVYPHNSDWDQIAEATGDPSWHSDSMWTYFERLELCQYVPQPAAGQASLSRHGFKGWLSTNKADPALALTDHELLAQIASAALQTLLRQVRNPTALLTLLLSRVKPDTENALKLVDRLLHPDRDWSKLAEDLVQNNVAFLRSLFDPNDWEFVNNSMEGLCLVPLAVTDKGRRSSPREFVLSTKAELEKSTTEPKGKLVVRTNVLVTRILFADNDAANTAVGVAYLQGERLYRATPPGQATIPATAAPPAAADPAPQSEEPQQVYVNREVILCAGAFNTPQLLMLSGIGPEAGLNKNFKDIHVRVNLPGVGKNLQDRYEIGVISELEQPFSILKEATFKLPESGKIDDAALQSDPALKEWNSGGKGLYATNGAVLGIILRSRRERPEPDLFIFGLPGYFKGYFQKYSQLLETGKNHFTWAILKAHTHNRAGIVTLRSADARDTPAINFEYFGDGGDLDDAREDLESLVEGVKFVRKITRLAPKLKRTLLPGKPAISLDGDVSDDVLRDFIRKETWGHHACGTCRMGAKTSDGMVPPGDREAVVDSDFRVYGTRNLRVVDASVFPRIPGFFIVTPIYMISEKASDVIHQDALTRGVAEEAQATQEGGPVQAGTKGT